MSKDMDVVGVGTTLRDVEIGSQIPIDCGRVYFIFGTFLAEITGVGWAADRFTDPTSDVAMVSLGDADSVDIFCDCIG